MEAIEKRYGGYKESKKVYRTLLKQQYENFAGLSLETLDQTFDRLQKLTSQMEIHDNLSDVVICDFLVTYPNSPQLAKEDLKQIDPDGLEGMDLHWEMAMLTIRARRAPKNQENRGRKYGRKYVPVENPTENALIAQDRIRGYDWSYQAKEEHPTKFALITLTSSGSSSNLDSKGNPQQNEYKEKGVIDSGCSRHMTGNKCYLIDYEDYSGGFVSFRDGKGRISG
nr:hypothetical protein [Tanacetum cinerariifolium]